MQHPSNMITISLEKRLNGCKSPPRPTTVQEGTTVATLLETTGEKELAGRVLIVIGNHVCDPSQVLVHGDAVVLISAVCGG